MRLRRGPATVACQLFNAVRNSSNSRGFRLVRIALRRRQPAELRTPERAGAVHPLDSVKPLLSFELEQPCRWQLVQGPAAQQIHHLVRPFPERLTRVSKQAARRAPGNPTWLVR